MAPRESVFKQSMDGARAVLRRYWGFDDFRSGQTEIIDHVIAKRDVLAILPTGGGKSVCYQVPAVLFGGLTVVVSPLIALMQDQVAGLNARGVPAAFINSQLSYREVEQRWLDAEHGRYRLLYLAPERLETETFRIRAPRLPIRLLAVDEAHCISEWGPDFRPSYRKIAEAADAMGSPPTMAVTATATPEVRRDISSQLGLREPAIVVRGFDRPNVVPSAFVTSAKHQKVKEVLTAVPGCAIMYVGTRAGAETWASRLAAEGVSAGAYHAGMPAADRLDIQSRWQDGEIRVIAATNAFGMGIDKPDVRLVLHVDLPHSLEAYYQEAGRAGRDGVRSFAALIFAESDIDEARSFVNEARPTPALVQKVYDATLSVAQIAVGSEADDIFPLDVEQVAGIVEASPMAVRAAADALVREGLWERVRFGRERGLIRFMQTPESISRYAERLENRALARFVTDLLRGVRAEAFYDWAELDLSDLRRRMNLPTGRILRGLEFLAQHDLLQHHPPGAVQRYRLLGARSQRVHIDRRALEENRRRAHARFEHVVRYARAITCRRRFLLAYFGESAPERCGSCDVCLGRHRPPVITPDDEPLLKKLLVHVRDGDEPQRWLQSANLPTHRIAGLADWLVHEGYVEPSDPLAGLYRLTSEGEKAVGR